MRAKLRYVRRAMRRYFNNAGPCLPDTHYMLPPERRLPGVRDLIEQNVLRRELMAGR